MVVIVLNPGDIIRYRYKNGWEYSRFLGEGIPSDPGTLHSPHGKEPPPGTTQVIEGVWKSEPIPGAPKWKKRKVFYPRAIVKIIEIGKDRS